MTNLLIKQFIVENKTNFSLNISDDKKVEMAKVCLLNIEGYSSVSESVLLESLECLRILSRDISMEHYICSPHSWEVLFSVAGIYQYSIQNEKAVSLLKHNANVVEECIKAMCNMTKNFYLTIPPPLFTMGVSGILKRVQLYDQMVPEITGDVKIFEMKLLFLMTALGPDTRLIVVQDCDGIHHLTSIIDSHLKNVKNIKDEDLLLDCEVLKVLFNMLYQNFPPELEKKVESEMKRLISCLKELLVEVLSLEHPSKALKVELTNNIANLLTSIPDICFRNLLFEDAKFPEEELYKSPKAMKCIQMFIDHLDLRLKENMNLMETITPMLHGLSKGCKADRNIRKYCRLMVLPYMKSEVLMLPEQGSTMRNKLCKLLQHAAEQVSEAVSYFLFVLCKENIERAIKYTGFGNFAGFLARHALLGGAKNEDDSGISYSESEESDTDEYVQLRDKINPVTGKVEENKVNPLEGMSEEQKEYEVVQLMKTIDLLQKGGLISPGVIGEDGNVRPAESVLEMVAANSRLKEQEEMEDSD